MDGARERAAALTEIGRHDDAVRMWREVLAADPADAEARCALAAGLFRLGQPQASLDTLSGVAIVEPWTAWAHRIRGHAYQQRGRRRQARRAFEAAVAADPDDAFAHAALAEVAAGRLQFARARAEAEAAVQLAPWEPSVHQASGFVAMHARRWKEAEAAYRHALELAPHDANGCHALGVALAKLGRHAEAQEHLEAAVRLAPGERAYRQGLTRITRWYQLRPFVLAVAGLVVLAGVLGTVVTEGTVLGWLLTAAYYLGLCGVLLAFLRSRVRARRTNPLAATVFREERRERLRFTTGTWLFIAGTMTVFSLFVVLIGVGAIMEEGFDVALVSLGLTTAGPPLALAVLAWLKLLKRWRAPWRPTR